MAFSITALQAFSAAQAQQLVAIGHRIANAIANPGTLTSGNLVNCTGYLAANVVGQARADLVQSISEAIAANTGAVIPYRFEIALNIGFEIGLGGAVEIT